MFFQVFIFGFLLLNLTELFLSSFFLVFFEQRVFYFRNIEEILAEKGEKVKKSLLDIEIDQN